MSRRPLGFLIAGLLCLAVAASASVPAGRITVLVNGRAVQGEAIQRNGVTYLPVRAIAEALGLSVKYDAATSVIYLEQKESSPPSVIYLEQKESSPPVEPGGIRGTVTYYFNENYKTKPDVGARAWLFQGQLEAFAEDDYVYALEGGRSLTHISADLLPPELRASKAEREADDARRRWKEQLDALGALVGGDTDLFLKQNEKVNAAQEQHGKAMAEDSATRGKYFEEIAKYGVELKSLRNTIVDGNGVFSFDNVVPGIYTVAIHSDHVEKGNHRDVSGAWVCLEVQVTPRQTADASWDFGRSSFAWLTKNPS